MVSFVPTKHLENKVTGKPGTRGRIGATVATKAFQHLTAAFNRLIEGAQKPFSDSTCSTCLQRSYGVLSRNGFPLMQPQRKKEKGEKNGTLSTGKADGRGGKEEEAQREGVGYTLR